MGMGIAIRPMLALCSLVAALSPRALLPSRPDETGPANWPDGIPRTIYLTYKSKAATPAASVERVRAMNPGFAVEVYGDEEIRAFLQQSFSTSHVEFFDSIKAG